MTRGPIDAKIIGDRLNLVASCVAHLRTLPTASLEEFLSDPRNAPAAESLLRRGIEALFDALRHILSRGFGVGALEYREVARQAAARGVVADSALKDRLLQIAGFRNRLTHFYDEVTPQELCGIARDEVGDLEALAEEVRRAALQLGS